MSKILICDDEPDIVSALTIYLTSEGYEVAAAKNGAEALEILAEQEIHLVLLDVMMPVCDGITALAEIRKRSNVPVILLTAKSEDTDKILGLNVGADDYVTKPFNPVELLARVRSCLRRYLMLGGNAKGTAAEKEDIAGQAKSHATEEEKAYLAIAGIELDDRTKAVTLDGDPVALTPTEYDILKFLMEHPGTVYAPEEIYQAIRKEPGFGSEGTIAVHIRHLREKLEYDPAEPRYLISVWGRGYKMRDIAEQQREQTL